MKRSFLTALGLEKEVVDSVMSEYGASVELLKEKHADALTTEKEKLQRKIEELQGQLDTAPDGGDPELKAKYDKLKKDFDEYKHSVETEKQTAVTTAAIRKQLEADGCNPKLIDLVLKAIDPSAARLKDGAIENWDELSKPVKEQYADVFGKVVQQGADVGTPPVLPGTFNPFKKGEHYSLAAQTELFRKDPALARRMAGEAGIKLTGG